MTMEPSRSLSVVASGRTERPKLLGYVLKSNYNDSGMLASEEIAKKCRLGGTTLVSTEFDSGAPGNPMRMGLWRALRRLICNRCPPKQMPFSCLDIDDFVKQALIPCSCVSPDPVSGIVVANIGHISSIPDKGARFCMLMAAAGKHVIANEGHCMSCCHPQMKRTVAQQSQGSSSRSVG